MEQGGWEPSLYADFQQLHLYHFSLKFLLKIPEALLLDFLLFSASEIIKLFFVNRAISKIILYCDEEVGTLQAELFPDSLFSVDSC